MVLLSKTAAGIQLAGEAWTVRSYADHWLVTVARARLRPATWTNYPYAVRVHIGPILGTVRGWGRRGPEAKVSYWPLAGTMLILMAGSFE